MVKLSAATAARIRKVVNVSSGVSFIMRCVVFVKFDYAATSDFSVAVRIKRHSGGLNQIDSPDVADERVVVIVAENRTDNRAGFAKSVKFSVFDVRRAGEFKKRSACFFVQFEIITFFVNFEFSVRVFFKKFKNFGNDHVLKNEGMYRLSGFLFELFVFGLEPKELVFMNDIVKTSLVFVIHI